MSSSCPFTSVADPVHFRPAPDPANQNFENRIRIRIILALSYQFKHRNFFHIKHISFDIWMMIKKMEKFTWKCVKALFKKKSSLFMQLYIAKVPIGSGYGENFPDPAPDPTKNFRIRLWIRKPAFYLSYQRLGRKDRCPRAFFAVQIQNCTGQLSVKNAVLWLVCYKPTGLCLFEGCGFCRFLFKIQNFMGWN